MSRAKYDRISDCSATGTTKITFFCGEKSDEERIFEPSVYVCSHIIFLRRYGVTRTINFKDCQFFELNRNYFEMFYNLQTFDISNVDLKTMQMNIFSDAFKIVNLDISHNKLEEIPALILAKSKQLKYANFSNNCIKRIGPGALDGTSLELLDLSYNQLDGNFSMKTLSHNNETNFNESIFGQLTKLKHLDLSFAGDLGKLESKTFSSLIDLEILNLKGANISIIEIGTFSQQHKLVSLDLSDNKLSRLDFTQFLPVLPHLQSLYLSENQLGDLDGFRNSVFPQLTLLGIQGNQFNCSYLTRFLESTNWEKIHLQLVSSLVNSQGSNIRGINCNVVQNISTELTELVDQENNSNAIQSDTVTEKTKPSTDGTNKFNCMNTVSTSNPNHFDGDLVKITLVLLCALQSVHFAIFVVIKRDRIFKRHTWNGGYSKQDEQRSIAPPIVEFTNEIISLELNHAQHL